jgi:hypothetical protein
MKMPVEDWDWSEHFHWSEFDDPESSEENSGLNMEPDFMENLFLLRKMANSPIVIHGAARGGYADGGHSTDSQHYLGLAADIHFPKLSYDRASQFIRSANFEGVGFYEHWKPMPGFHVDMGSRRARWVRTANGLYVSLT